MDDAAFLRAVCWDPFDDGPRLVWADALDERGDPRGEFIRVQCELARWPCECDTSEERVYHEECRCKERGELQRRERELAMRRCAAWAETDGVMKALGADHVRRLGLSMGYTDLEFSLDGRHIAIGNFRRGLVASVTLTAAQFFGGPCEQCGGRGYTLPGADSFLIERKGCSACGGNNWKDGTGHVEGVAAALFRAAPMTSVTLSDKRPHHLPRSGDYQWYFGVGNGGISDTEENVLPAALRLGQKQSRFNFEHEAMKALSEWCVSLGRQLADLPGLVGMDKIERAGECS